MTQSNQGVPPSFTTHIGYISDPQADQPLGVRVVEPPPNTRQFARGFLYSVVELTGAGSEHTDVVDRLLSTIQRTYYTVKGSQSQVLIEAVSEARAALRDLNDQRTDAPLQAGMMCAALLRNRLMVISSGPCVALIRLDSNVTVFPSEVVHIETDIDGDPHCELYRQQVLPGDAIFVGGGGWLAAMPLRTLASTVAYVTPENCSDAADGLYAESQGAGLPGLLVVLDGSDPSGMPPATDDLDPSPKRRRPYFPGLPTALGALPPLDVPVSQPAPGVRSTTGGQPTSGAVVAQPVVDSTSDPAVDGQNGPPSGPTLLDEPVMTPQKPRISASRLAAGSSAAILAGVRRGVDRSKVLFAGMLPDQSPTEDLDYGAEYEARGHAPDVSQMAAQHKDTAPPASSSSSTSGQPPAIQPFTPPPPARGGRARLFVLIALLIAVLVPVVILSDQFINDANAEAEADVYVKMAESQILSAQDALNIGDTATGRGHLTKASNLLEQAAGIIGRTEQIEQLSAEIDRERQDVLRVQPLYGLVEPLVTFPPDAEPHRILVENQDVYVLDTGRQVVQRFQVDPTGVGVLDPQGDVILSQGDVVEGVPVDRLADIAWQPLIPGIEDKSNLLVLDRNQTMYRFNARVEGATLLELGDQAQWQAPVQIGSYLGRIYVADEGAGQIYRYEPGRYQASPEPWFAPQTSVNLAGLLTMAIDGDIWMLLNNGMVLRYSSGEQVPFSLDDSIGYADKPVDMAVGSDQNGLIYLADAADERIVVYDKDGAYLYQLTASEGDPLRDLRGIYVDDVTSSLYILTDSALFWHPLPR